jgi:hypothetical protein
LKNVRKNQVRPYIRYWFLCHRMGKPRVCPFPESQNENCGKSKEKIEKPSQMKYNTIMSIKEKINDNLGPTATPHISDTPPQIREILIAGYRRMSPREKLKRVSELTKAVQQLALARIRQQYEGISEQEQRLRLGSLWLDRDTMIRVFNWDPFAKGY